MSGISHLAASADVSESENVQTTVTRRKCIHGVDGHEDGPGDQPDRKECEGHDPEEANKKVRVQTVG